MSNPGQWWLDEPSPDAVRQAQPPAASHTAPRHLYESQPVIWNAPPTEDALTLIGDNAVQPVPMLAPTATTDVRADAVDAAGDSAPIVMTGDAPSAHVRRSHQATLATFAVMASTALGSLLGFAREALIARSFGATSLTDAYATAFFIPNMLQNFLISGSITIIFIPILADYIQRGNRQEVWRVVSLVGNIVLLAISALVVAGLVFAPQFVSVYAPLLPPTTRALTIHLTRILFVSVLGFALTAYLVAVLNAFKVFGAPSLATSVFNVVIIGTLLVIGSRYGIEGLTWATLAGGLLQIVVVIGPLARLRPRYTPALALRDPAARQLFRLALPQFASVLMGQAYLMVERILASGLVYGSISALNYANKLWVVPVNLLGTSLLTVLFPQLAEEAAQRRFDKLVNSMVQSFRLLLAVLLPISLLCMVLAVPITRLIYERGAFNERDVQLTGACLLFASAGIVPVAGVWLCTRVLFALKDARAPLVLGVVINVPFIVLNIILARWLAAPGLALCYSLSSLAYLITLLIAIRRHVGSIGGPRLVDGLWKMGVSGAVLMVVALVTLYRVPQIGGHTTTALLQCTAASAAGGIAYVLAIACFRLPELSLAASMVRSSMVRSSLGRARGR